MWHNTRLLNAFASALYALLALGCLGVGAMWLMQRPMFQLQQVRVMPLAGSELHHVSGPSVRKRSRTASSVMAATPSTGSPPATVYMVSRVRAASGKSADQPESRGSHSCTFRYSASGPGGGNAVVRRAR